MGAKTDAAGLWQITGHPSDEEVAALLAALGIRNLQDEVDPPARRHGWPRRDWRARSNFEES